MFSKCYHLTKYNVKENAITRSCITEKLSSRKLRLFALCEKVIAFQLNAL